MRKNKWVRWTKVDYYRGVDQGRIVTKRYITLKELTHFIPVDLVPKGRKKLM